MDGCIVSTNRRRRLIPHSIACMHACIFYERANERTIIVKTRDSPMSDEVRSYESGSQKGEVVS